MACIATIVVQLNIAARAARADDSAQLLVIGQGPQTATFDGVAADGSLVFRSEGGDPNSVALGDLVRWSTPDTPRLADELWLRDGSRLCLSPAWTQGAGVTCDQQSLTAMIAQFRRVEVSRSLVRALFWRLPPEAVRRQAIIDKALSDQSSQEKADLVMLDNGDQLRGVVDRITANERSSISASESGSATLTLEGELGRLELPLERVRGVVFSDESAVSQSDDAKDALRFSVGFRDGSRLTVSSLTREDEQLAAAAVSLGRLTGFSPSDVVSMQALGERADLAYLSDVPEVAFREQPYLELPWGYGRDRNVLRGPLRAGGRTFIKGLAAHSTAQFTWKLDGRFDRFAASLAVDDAADGRGSVIFRVLLQSDGGWRETYVSPVIRGGDPPLPVAVDLAGADQLELEVKYADRGDECDYADWLDARLERTRTQRRP